MNSTHGVRVWRSGSGEATLLAYHVLPHSDCPHDYLALVYRSRRAYAIRTQYALLLDAIPVQSFSLTVPLRVEESLSRTVRAWRLNIYIALRRAIDAYGLTLPVLACGDVLPATQFSKLPLTRMPATRH